MHLGFYLEGNRTFITTTDFQSTSFELKPSFGFGLGISADFDISRKVSIGSVAGISFSESSVEFYYGPSLYHNYTTRVYPINLDFRLNGKYALSEKKSKLYLLFGPSVMMPIAPKKVPETNTVTNTSLSIDVGLGFDKYLKSFRFAPEVRYSYGLINLSQTGLLQNLKAHRFTLALHFKD